MIVINGKRRGLWRWGCLVFGVALLTTACNKKEEPTASASEPAASVVDSSNVPITLTVWCWDPNFNVYAMNEAVKIN